MLGMELSKDQVQFIKDNIKLKSWFLGRMGLIIGDGVNKADFEHWDSVIFDAMVKAVKTYDSSKSEFSTYFNTVAKNAIISEQRKIDRYNDINMLDKYDNTELFNNIGCLDDYNYFELTYGIDGREKRVLDLKIAGYTEQEIASELGVHRRTVSRAMSKAREMVRDNMGY